MAVDGRDGDPDRVTIYKPVWQGPFEAYSRKFVGKNLWRVASIFDFDDAVQECALIFVRCARLYEGRIDNPAWFMSVFKQALFNDFNTFARRNERSKLNDVAAYESRPTDRECADDSLAVALSRGSKELVQVLTIIAQAPSELLRLALEPSAQVGPDDEVPANEAQWSRRLCRLCRVKKIRSDLISELRGLLS